MRYSDDPSSLGTKLGPKIAKMVADAIIWSNRGLAQHKHDVGMAVFNSASDQISDEVHEVLAPVLGMLLAEDLPPHTRKLIEQLHHKHGQLTALSGQQVVGQTLGAAISPLINSALYPVTSRILSGGQAQQPPDYGTLASLVAKGIGNESTEIGDMVGQGLRDYYTGQLIEANRSYPDLSTALEMLRRGVASDRDLELFLTRAGIPDQYHVALISLWRNPLSPADLADMVVRGIITQDEGARVATQSGVSAEDFDKLVLDTGEPIALMQLLEARRRGFIDEDRLRRGILQSRIRNEWIDVAEKLAYEPMSVADAVNAVVQNHLSMQQGEAIAQQNGLEPNMFGILYETAGEPLSRTEMEELYNRGLVTQEQVNQALRESRVKDKYVDLAFQLHRKVPPIFTVQRALKSGSISHDDAVRVVMESGYAKADAEWIVAAGTATSTESSSSKVITAVEELYIGNAISQADALAAFKAQGLSEHAAQVTLSAAEFRREAKISAQVIAAIRSRFIGRHITANVASGLLDKIGIPTQQRDILISLWSVEQSANVRTLTEAQVVKAVAKQIITADEGAARLTAMGYSATDAQLLLEGA